MSDPLPLPPQALPQRTTGPEYPPSTSSSPTSSPSTRPSPSSTTRPGETRETLLSCRISFTPVTHFYNVYRTRISRLFIGDGQTFEIRPRYKSCWRETRQGCWFVSCSVSLPVRKSCGIVDSVSFLTAASICAPGLPPPPHPTSTDLLPLFLFFFFLCSHPSLSLSPLRLDTDGIDLLMSFLKVSPPKSSRRECDVKIWR